MVRKTVDVWRGDLAVWVVGRDIATAHVISEDVDDVGGSCVEAFHGECEKR